MKEKTTAALWKRLEQICISKTLTSKLHTKQCLYVHRLEEGASVHEHLIAFKEILSDLEAMEGEGLIVRERQDRNVDDDRGRTNEGKTCNFCKKKGRIKSECYKLQNKIKREAANQKGKQPEKSSEANIVEDYSNSELLVASVNNSKVSEEWILDSGCTFHISPNQDWFTTYETVSKVVVLIGNNASYKIASVGTIKVKMFDKVVSTLSNVRYIPELKGNLISLSTFDSKGYKYTTESGDSTITGDIAITSSSLSDDEVTKLWHMRLGYISENNMEEMSKSRLLDGQEICKLKFCEHYVFGNRSPSVAIEKKTLQEKYAETDLVTYVLNVTEDIYANQEPSNYSEAISYEDSEKWMFAIQKEMKSLHKNKTWDLVELPKGKKGLGVDFTDVFSPVVKHSSIRALLAKKILGMEILRIQKGTLRKFFAGTVSTPLVAHFRLSSALSPQSDDEIKHISHIPYSSAMGSLMYAMFGRTRDRVIRYVDVDFAGDFDRRRSLTCYVFIIGGCAISWKATLQTIVALPTIEAKYMAITEAYKEAIWLKGLFSELNEDLQISIVFCDN
ncbi:hypothetical protein CXB51_010427 [Gossypium anomalum]|uniref:Retrovirus-related Pol polyprotein from transposon TNT 1-94 n=1 Tax=Gossypium anomalum TaxID=47600 RepID=A0A8J6D4D1_9ROSI|nr:hypothetical protein CXB51_010427 [Gossypium anomalum]